MHTQKKHRAFLAHWYNKNRITTPLGLLMGSLILSQAVGAPLAAGLMKLDGLPASRPLRGWQWLFLIEGALAVIVGCGWFFLPADIDKHKKLTVEERGALHASLAAGARPHASPLAALKGSLRNPAVWLCSLMKLCRDVGFYGGFVCVVCWWVVLLPAACHCAATALPLHQTKQIRLNKQTTKTKNKGIIYFSPLIIKSMLGGEGDKGASSVQVILFTAIPFLCAVPVQLVIAFSSYKFNDRRFHVAGCWAFGTFWLAMTAIIGGTLHDARAAFGLLVLSIVGIYGAEGVLISYLLALQGGEKVSAFFVVV